MGCPGVGVVGRAGAGPGRGAGAAGIGRGCACCCKRATMSGRGGTTGLAAGWPARPGRTCWRKGTLGDGAVVTASAERYCWGAGGALGPAGRGIASGRGVPGIVVAAASGVPGEGNEGGNG